MQFGNKGLNDCVMNNATNKLERASAAMVSGVMPGRPRTPFPSRGAPAAGLLRLRRACSVRCRGPAAAYFPNYFVFFSYFIP